MKNLLKNKTLELTCVILTLSSLSLIKIFPFYLTASNSKFLSTHAIAKLLLIIPFLYVALKEQILHTVRKKLDILFIVPLLLYFFASTLSVVAAIDIASYLRQLQNVIVNCVLFYVGYHIFLKKKFENVLFDYLLVVGIFCFIFDIVFLLWGDAFIDLIKNNVQVEIMALFVHNSNMQRYNSYLVLDSFIPIFFLTYHYSEKRKFHFFLLLTTIVISMFLSYASLFRTRLIQGLFALIFSFLLFVKEKKRFIFSMLSIPFLLIIIFFMVQTISPTSLSIIDRFLLSDKQEDVETIQYRFSSLQNAIELLQSSPFVGVGLGNYKAYMSRVSGYGIENRLTKVHYEETINNPHSIFIEVLSETGLVGFIGYIGLLGYFLYKDMRVLTNSKEKQLSSIIVFAWTVFLYGIFNPFNTVYISGWFWFMRGYILYKQLNTSQAR